MIVLKKNMEKRIFENPIIKDKVTILKSPQETGHAYMLLEVELHPKGGNDLHYHTNFSEEFIPVEGELAIGLAKRDILLLPGQRSKVEARELHRFYNPSNRAIRFQIRTEPAQEGFLNGLKIFYGLAEDGLTNKKGIPKKWDHLAILCEMSATRPVGFLSLITPFLLRRAKNPKLKPVKEALIKKYC